MPLLSKIVGLEFSTKVEFSEARFRFVPFSLDVCVDFCLRYE